MHDSISKKREVRYMFYLKIFLTHLDFRWRLTSLRKNYLDGSIESYIDVVTITDKRIGLKKEIRHGKFVRVWTKKV